MDKEQLNEQGWIEVRKIDSSSFFDTLIEYGHEIGTPVKNRNSLGIVQQIVPVATEKAYPNSLSSRYAKEAFPFHVDTAHWMKPCRYVILGCIEEGESKRPTTLFDINALESSKDEEEALFNASFLIKNGRHSFYGSVLSRSRDFIRFDPGCMTPANELAHKVSNLFSHERTKISTKNIEWAKGKILIIDNWRVLHGRGNPTDSGVDRELYRVLVA